MRRWFDSRGVELIHEIAGLIDHTCLSPAATRADVEHVCGEAVQYGFFGVCVAPCHVPFVARLLDDAPTRVITVAGFPNGDSATTTKVIEATKALDAGAREIDMVMRIGAVKGGDIGSMADDVAAVAEAVHEFDGALLKVILETALLSHEEIVVACRAAVESGADFVKTSTGFSPAGGAGIEAVRLMRETVGDRAGVKAAGGIRDYDTACAMIEAGATRIGASASVDIVREALERARGSGV